MMDTADRIFDEILAVMSGDAAQAARDPLPTSAGPMQPEQIIDYLTYCSYRHNRQTMSAEQLATLWPETGAAMEQRYQDEINAYANAMVQRDTEARHEGKPEHDLDVVGRALRAGT